MAGLNPNNATHMQRLRQAIMNSRTALQPFREQQMHAIKQYHGSHYGSGDNRRSVPVNFLELAINIYLLHLVAYAPRALALTERATLKASAKRLELYLDHLIAEIKLGKANRAASLQAMFSLGIVKVGLNRTATIEIDGFRHDVGQPYADPVLLGDWVHDTRVGRYEQVRFAGNQYFLPLEHAKEAEGFQKGPREALLASERSDINEAGDEREQSLSGGSTDESNEFGKRVQLWDIWLPLENLFVTFPVAGEGPPLRVIDWDGPEGGPYHLLGFHDVPGNIMPLPPASLQMDLHELANKLFRKLGSQAERQKSVLILPPGAQTSGIDIKNAKDGEIILAGSEGKEHSFGGMDPATFAFFLQVKQLHSWLGGNIDALGGLAPQAETLGQEKMLTATASKRMADMQDRTVEFAVGILKDLGWYGWTDPLIDVPLVKRPAGTSLQIPVSFNAEQREGDYYEYNIQIHPYSMQHRGPAERLQTIMQIMERVIIPFMPMLQQQGKTIEAEPFLRLVAKYADLPELAEIIKFAPFLPEAGAAPDEARQPSSTTRRYVRENRPGATQQGQADVMGRVLMGAGVQQSEANSLSRQPG